jgi:hypothetical protein
MRLLTLLTFFALISLQASLVYATQTCVDNASDAMSACSNGCPKMGEGGSNKAYYDCQEKCQKDFNSRMSDCQRQDTTNQRAEAEKEKNGQKKIAIVSASVGGVLAGATCHPTCPLATCNPTLCAIGVTTGLGSIPMFMQASASGRVQDYETYKGGKIDNPCTRDPNGDECKGYNLNPPPEIPPPNFTGGYGNGKIPDFKSLYNDPNLSPEDKAFLNELHDAAKAGGVDIMDPETAKKYLGKGGTPSAEEAAAAMANMPPAVKAALEKAKQKYENKYANIGSGDADDGGGGNMAGKGSTIPDLAALLGAGDEEKRGPASLDGIGKVVGDSVIGVAGDNIFDMVKRRYQKKIDKSQFLPAPLMKYSKGK